MADLDAYVNAYLVEPLVMRRQWQTARTERDFGGLPQRRGKWAAARYEFDCRAVFRDATAANSFLGFFDGKKGGLTSFTWTCPRDNHVYTCVFESDALEETWDGSESYEVAFVLLGVA